ncbi:MAG: hypothetical protein EAZ85_11480 [Bacteroidetes bacterium]|nr:MAG: hypothetical protein EAZ85_11480 [Bacteroidota bacterium]
MIHIKLQVEVDKVEAVMQLLNDSGLVEHIEVVENAPAQNIPPIPAPVAAEPVPVTNEPLMVDSAPVVLDIPVVVEAPPVVVTLADFESTTLKPMTATEFYKKVNASNLAQKEKRIFSQNFMEKEVQSW